MVNITNYKPHSEVTKEMLKDNNFKFMDGIYVYRFPVYKYKKEPMLWCNIYVDIENDICNLQVVDQRNNTYAPFFNREYSANNVVVEYIDKRIASQIGVFVKSKILKKRGKE